MDASTPNPDNALQELEKRQLTLHAKINHLREECSQLDLSIDQLRAEISVKSPHRQTPPPLPVQPPREPRVEAPKPEPAILPSFESEASPAPPPRQSAAGPVAARVRVKTEPVHERNTVKSGEWEMTLGKVWFVRFGVLSLLTGLIFLGNYAYHNWFFAATAAVKLSTFMLISLALAFGGMLFEKKKQDLRRYGRVVTAGGLAAGYYTIYASHFVESLKVVHSPPLAASLLTLWAGVILAYASRKRSRIISVMAIGMAFYGTMVNPTGWLSLFSALLLSASGIYLLVRYRWVSVGLVTVAAAYISHTFWLCIYPDAATDAVRLSYLASYWVLFTTALMVPSCHSLPSYVPRILAAFNNTAAWLLTSYSVITLLPHDYMGEFSMGFGAFLLLCSAAASTDKLWPSNLTSTYAYQGIFILTVGIMITYAGYARFLILATEACVLLAAGMRKDHNVTKVLSAPIYFLSLICCVVGTLPANPTPVFTAFALLNAIYSILTRYAVKDEAVSNATAIAIIPAFFTWLILSFGVFSNVAAAYSAPGLLATSLALAFTYSKAPRLSAIRELVLVTPVALVIAAWWQCTASATGSAFLSYLTIAGFTGYWFLSQHIHDLSKDTFGYQSILPPAKDSPIGWVTGVLALLVAYCTLNSLYTDTLARCIIPSAIAITAHLVSEKTKRLSLSLPGMGGYLISISMLVAYSGAVGRGGLIIPLLLAMHMLLVEFILKSIDREKLRPLLALGISISLVPLHQYIPHTSFVYLALALVYLLWAKLREDSALLFTGTLIALALSQIFNAQYYGDSAPITYLCLLAALIIHPLTRWITGELRPFHTISAVFTLILFFAAATMDVSAHHHGQGISVTWTLLAFFIFSLGLITKYRLYRYTGLIWLAIAGFHVICVDVMRFDTLGRILSFIVLGITFIVLGYLYNRFQEHIKKLL